MGRQSTDICMSIPALSVSCVNKPAGGQTETQKRIEDVAHAARLARLLSHVHKRLTTRLVIIL